MLRRFLEKVVKQEHMRKRKPESRNTAATTIIKSKYLFSVLEGHIIQYGGAHKTSVLIQPIPFLCRQISSLKIVFDNLRKISSTSGGFL